MRAFNIVPIALTILGVSSSAHADTATVTDPLPIVATISSTFVNPQPTDTTYTGVGTDFFTYGESLGTPNQLTVTGSSISTFTGSDFALGRLTYFNGGTFNGTTADSVQLDMVVTLSAPISTSVMIPLTLNLLTTVNNTGAADPDSDYVSASLAPTPFFSVDGTLYQLKLVGFNNLSGSGSLFDSHTLRLGEQLSTAADLIAVVTPVPEPSSLVLLGIGLILPLWRLLRRRS